MRKVNVTKTFLPPLEEYQRYLDKIWDSGQLTNQGSLLREFESKMMGYLGVRYFHFVANGTLALQLALKSLGIAKGEVITTPFSYVATLSAILWERCTPVFVDIEPDTFCIDADKIECAITKKTKAILAVHVFGHPCDIEKIETIAQKHKLKVIYDGAHAFGVKINNRTLLSYGDISVGSFHATKVFHTIEGGCIIPMTERIGSKAELIKRFGHNFDDHQTLGINAKASEFQAAMGLCNLKYVDSIIGERKKLAARYDKILTGKIQRPKINTSVEQNFAYYPVIFQNETRLLKVLDKLKELNIFPRRYFYPSLNTLPYLKNYQTCPVSESISKRVLCLPLHPGLDPGVINRVGKVVTG